MNANPNAPKKSEPVGTLVVRRRIVAHSLQLLRDLRAMMAAAADPAVRDYRAMYAASDAAHLVAEYLESLPIKWEGCKLHVGQQAGFGFTAGEWWPLSAMNSTQPGWVEWRYDGTHGAVDSGVSRWPEWADCSGADHPSIDMDCFKVVLGPADAAALARVFCRIVREQGAPDATPDIVLMDLQGDANEAMEQAHEEVGIRSPFTEPPDGATRGSLDCWNAAIGMAKAAGYVVAKVEGGAA